MSCLKAIVCLGTSVLLFGCQSLSVPQRETRVWVCDTGKVVQISPSPEVHMETYTPGEIMGRFLAGDMPDGIVFHEDEVLQPVGYFIDWAYMPSEELPESVWTLRLMRGVRGTEREQQLETWSRSQNNVYFPTNEDYERSRHEEREFVKRLETTLIEKLVYQKTDITDVVADLNRRAIAEGFGKAPIILDLDIPKGHLRTLTVELEDVTFLDVMDVISHTFWLHYIISGDQIWLVHRGDGYAFTQRNYRVNPVRWENWLEKLQAKTTPAVEDPKGTERDPFVGGPKESELGSLVGAALGFGPVRQFELQEEGTVLVVELPVYDFYTLEDLLYILHKPNEK